MRPLFLALMFLTACAESSSEEQAGSNEAAIEKQIEGDAKSLEAAADEAVSVLQSKIEDSLKADGVPPPVPIKKESDES
ncbi:hypothetical protein AB1K62_04125 [Parasphingorhabdus sp. JC815]|uniref:hypothetical protein n=1 Tax=Parasphingorhabdus sp. JC815 TaxID=3232140 RepID=UPI0034583286